jgi:ABC-type oligopeptide transport system substrate-binding subunit
MFLHLWVADYPDPDCYLRVCVEDDRKIFGWHNALYDELIERARRITHQPERMQLYRQAEQILVEEMPILPTTYGRVHVLLKPWLKNYRLARMKQQFWHEIVLDNG